MTAPAIGFRFRAARETLGVGDDADAAAIKRAYRTAVAAHPPDADPEAFRRIREAYELLSEPMKHAGELLSQPVSFVPPPPLPNLPPTPPGTSLPVQLLRTIIGRQTAENLLAPPTKT